MAVFSSAGALGRLPEAFVSETSMSREVSRAVRSGKLRKLASRLYTRNLTDAPEAIVRRNLWTIVAGYFPGALIADRTALENAPASDGSVCLISERGADVHLPGVTLRPRRGQGAQKADKPFIGGLFLSSTARAYLENMRVTRARGGLVPRTLRRPEIEARLDTLIRQAGEDDVKRLRDETRALAPVLGMEREAADLDALIGTLLGTRDAALHAPEAIARQKGAPYDPDRLVLFQELYAALRNTPPVTRFASERTSQSAATLAFFEAYFSNFIEGTEFDVAEASRIVFEGVIPTDRPEDAHDVLGTWRIVSDDQEMRRTPEDVASFARILKQRHAMIMASRLDKGPGTFKSSGNRAGQTVFVFPDLTAGTLAQGFDLYRSLETPFQRAVFLMFLVSEVHPFADGNGRTARIMMNAELIAAEEERIVVPTVYRSEYLSALKALSQNGRPEPLIRVLDYAQRWTATVPWSTVDATSQELTACNAFLDSAVAEREEKRLLMPGATPAIASPTQRRAKPS